MRKFTFLFFILSFVFSTTINAQIKKGSVFLGGDIGGSTYKTKNGGVTVNNRNGFAISPVVGKAIKENLIVGAEVSFTLFENNNSVTNPNPVYANQRNAGYGAGVFIRRYKQIAKSDFSMFVQGGFDVNYGSNKYQTSPTNSIFDKSKTYSLAISAYPGVSYTISRKLQLETGFNNLLSVGYFSEKREITGTPNNYSLKTKGINVNTSLDSFSSLYLGFRLLISKS